VRSLLAFWELAPADPTMSGRLEAFGGDVSQPRLGLEEAAYKQLSGEVTNIIHSAGNVKLNQSMEDARRSAVDSTRHILALADACREHGRLRKLEFVSTVGVAGRWQGVVPERPLREPREFHNTYEAAKAEAEELLLEEMARGLPATVHRPSMVVGDSRTGKIIHFQVFYYLCEFLSGKRTFGIVPDAGDVRLDIIPVDYVASAIQISSRREDTAGRILHLCSGPSHAPRITDLAEQLRKRFTAYGARLARLRKVPPGWIRGLLPAITRVAPRSARRALESLPFFLAYLDEQQLFDNTRTQAFLAVEGVAIPRVEEYLDAILRYYWTHRPQSGAKPRSAVGAGGVA
jgi:nucleoside-diphosphate-sugar epimerase